MKFPLKGNFLSRDQTWNTTQFRRKAARGSPDHASGKLPWVLSISEIKLLEKERRKWPGVRLRGESNGHTHTHKHKHLFIYMQGVYAR